MSKLQGIVVHESIRTFIQIFYEYNICFIFPHFEISSALCRDTTIANIDQIWNGIENVHEKLHDTPL